MMETKYWVGEKGSSEGWMGFSSNRPPPSKGELNVDGEREEGEYENSRRPQIRWIEMRDTGIETRNHLPQSNCRFITPKAIRFCGDEMGDERPSMFALRAIPNTSAGPKGALCGRVRRMGQTREKVLWRLRSTLRKSMRRALCLEELGLGTHRCHRRRCMTTHEW